MDSRSIGGGRLGRCNEPAWDLTGRRRAQHITYEDATVEEFWLDYAGRSLVRERDDDGWQRWWHTAPGDALPIAYTINCDESWDGDDLNESCAQVPRWLHADDYVPDTAGTNRATYLLIRNMRGDVLPLATTDGRIIESYAYSLYGAVAGSTCTLVKSSTLCAMDICLTLPQCTERVPAPGQRPVVTSHGNTTLWAGVHRDLETGWDWMGARVYLPELRQFLSRDPAGYSVSFDEWAYTPGDPWNYLDRSGWSPQACGNGRQCEDDWMPEGISIFGGMSRDLNEWLQEEVEPVQDAAIALVVHNAPRIEGVFKTAGGAAEVVVGAAAWETGIGILAVLHGLDTVKAGLHQIITDTPVQTYTSQGIQSGAELVGLDEDTAYLVAEITDGLLGAALSAGAGAALKGNGYGTNSIPAGGGSGPWVPDNVVPGGAVAQTAPGSCVSACAEMLTEGAISQAEALEALGEWSSAEALADFLGPGWSGGGFNSADDVVIAASNPGGLGAVFGPIGGPGHMVFVKPHPSGYIVHDPFPGVNYVVDSQWLRTWVVEGVFKRWW